MDGSGNPRVTSKGGGHGTGNDLLILPQVCQRGKRQSPVGDLSSPSAVSDSIGTVAFKCGTYWTPKMSACVHTTPGEHKRDNTAPEKSISTEEVFSRGGRAQPSGKGGSHFVLGEGVSGAEQTRRLTGAGRSAPHVVLDGRSYLFTPTSALSVVLGRPKRALLPLLRVIWSSADAERAISPILDDQDPTSVSTTEIIRCYAPSLTPSSDRLKSPRSPALSAETMSNHYSQQHPYGYAQYTQPVYTPEFQAGQMSPNYQVPFPASNGQPGPALGTPAHRPKHFSRNTNTTNDQLPYKSALKNGQMMTVLRTENGIPVNVPAQRRISKSKRERGDSGAGRGRKSEQTPHVIRPVNSSNSTRRDVSMSRQRTNSKTRFIPGKLNPRTEINTPPFTH